MILSKQAIEEMAHQIQINNVKYYEHYIQEYKQKQEEISQDEYLLKIIEDILENEIEFHRITEASVTADALVHEELIKFNKKVKKRIKYQKNKIFTDIENENEKRLAMVKETFKMHFNNPILLSGYFKTLNYKEYVAKLKEENRKWNDENKDLIEHPFIDLSGGDKDVWIRMEMSCIIVTYLLDDSLSLLRFSIPHSKELSQVNWFAISKQKIPEKELVISDDKSLFEYQLSDICSMLIPSRLSAPGKESVPVYRILDTVDWQIINKIMSFIDTDFFETKSVIINKSDLVKLLSKGRRPSSKDYDNLVNRMNYIASLTFKMKNGEGVYKTSTLFSLIEDQEKYIVKFGDVLYDDIVKNRVINITQKSLLTISDNAAKQLLVDFQNARANIYMNDPSQSNRTKVYKMSFFRQKFRLSTKQNTKNKEIITKALNEFKDNHIVIEDFSISVANEAIITFLPLSSSEIEDLNFFGTQFAGYISE